MTTTTAWGWLVLAGLVEIARAASIKYTQGWTDQGKAVPYAPDPKSEKTCANTPSGKCETDNYPRWRETTYR